MHKKVLPSAQFTNLNTFHIPMTLDKFTLFIQVWSTSTCEFVRTLNGHKRGIACLQYRDRLVVSGSSDNTIRYIISYVLLVAIMLSAWFILVDNQPQYRRTFRYLIQFNRSWHFSKTLEGSCKFSYYSVNGLLITFCFLGCGTLNVVPVYEYLKVMKN